MQRLTEQQHHVVGHVDRERDGAHPDLGQALLHPPRARRRRVDAPDDAGDVAVAPRTGLERALVGERHGIPVVVGRSDVEPGRVAELATRRQGVLAGDPAHGEAVAAVRRHVDLDDLVAQAEQGDGVVAGRQTGRCVLTEQLGEDDDAVVVLAQAQLGGRADHAVGDVAVGLACRDLEPAGQHPTGQHDDDEVAGSEVVGAADDLLGLVLGHPLAVVAHVDGAPVDRLAVLLGLGLDAEDSTHDQRAGEVPAVQALLLEPDADERRGDVDAPGVRRDVGELTQPRDGGVHQISIPNWREKRTSPSTMSCMSAIPWRSMSERSMPRPNAKPV